MSETLKNLDETKAQTPSSLELLQEKLKNLKEQHDSAVKIEAQQQQDMINMAIKMAEGNEDLSKKVEGPRGQFDRQPEGQNVPRHAKSHEEELSKFLLNRRTEIREKTESIEEKQRKLEEMRKTVAELSESGNIDAESLKSIEDDIAAEEKQIEVDLEEVQTVEKNRQSDYNELSHKYDLIMREQRDIATDQIGFAIKAVAETYKDVYSEEQLEKFKEAALAEYKKIGREKNEREWIKEDEATLEKYKNILDKFEEKSAEVKKEIEADLGEIYDNNSRQISESVKAQFAEIDSKIKKEIGAFFFTSKTADKAAEAYKEYENLTRDYYSKLANIANKAHKLLGEALYENRDGGEDGWITVKRLSEYVTLQSHSSENAAIDAEMKTVREKADLTKLRAKEMLESTERYYQQVKSKALTDIDLLIKNLIPEHSRQEYLEKIKSKRGYL